MQRLRNPRALILNSLGVPYLKKKALNSWSAVEDTLNSTKELYESHKVVFTVSTSIASVATACVGYSLRYAHQTKVEGRLATIETSLKKHQAIERAEVEKIIGYGYVSTPSCIATAATTLLIGCVLGWRGGRRHAIRKLRKEQMKKEKEQMKVLGQIKPRRWQRFEFLKRPFSRSRVAEDSLLKTSEAPQSNLQTSCNLPSSS